MSASPEWKRVWPQAAHSAGSTTRAAVGVGRVSQSGTVKIRIPVVGGTGKYRNARGVVIVKASASSARLTLLLIP